MAAQQPPTPTSPSPSPSPPQQPGQLSTPQRQLPYHGTNPFVHNVALGVTPIALLALFLPPRRLDLRLGVLGGVALWGTNQLVHDYSGTSSLHRLGRRLQALSGTELPDKAKETQARLRAERARRLQLQQQEAAAAALPEEQRRLLEEQRRKQKEAGAGAEAEEEEEPGILERLWMGDSGEDWKEKRDRREKEALKEGGGGYWGLITDQISEVWNMGKKKTDEGEKQEKGSSGGEPKKS
ncbi:hypothetical protein F4818DRAFT_378416 [Hypoxylon cercidicola]|nr:hypothetical protein F4818DRAFT_378416 [Hypoxylon cercidicola]